MIDLVVGRMRTALTDKPRFVVRMEVEVEVNEPDEGEAVKEALASLDADAAIVSCAVLAVRREES